MGEELQFCELCNFSKIIFTNGMTDIVAIAVQFPYILINPCWKSSNYFIFYLSWSAYLSCQGESDRQDPNERPGPAAGGSRQAAEGHQAVPGGAGPGTGGRARGVGASSLGTPAATCKVRSLKKRLEFAYKQLFSPYFKESKSGSLVQWNACM